MNKLAIEEGIIKVIDGEMYYKSHYCYWLYTQLEEMQTRIDKALKCLQTTDDNIYDYEIIEKAIDILEGEDDGR